MPETLTPRTVTHDTTLAYDAAGALDPAWSQKAYESLVDGTMEMVLVTGDEVESVWLTGPCPRCHGTIRFHQVLTAVNTDADDAIPKGQSTAKGQGDGSDSIRSIVAYCTCDGTHAGRPAAVTGGCGTGFLIELASA